MTRDSGAAVGALLAVAVAVALGVGGFVPDATSQPRKIEKPHERKTEHRIPTEDRKIPPLAGSCALGPPAPIDEYTGRPLPPCLPDPYTCNAGHRPLVDDWGRRLPLCDEGVRAEWRETIRDLGQAERQRVVR